MLYSFMLSTLMLYMYYHMSHPSNRHHLHTVDANQSMKHLFSFFSLQILTPECNTQYSSILSRTRSFQTQSQNSEFTPPSHTPPKKTKQ